MFARFIWGLFIAPVKQWEEIRDQNLSLGKAITYVMMLAAIPVVCAFVGSTQFGWRVGSSDVVKLTTESAAIIAVLYYAVLVVATLSVGWMVHWMGSTYGASKALTHCIVLAAFIPTPLFLIGVFQLAPILWLNLVVALPALAYTVFLLYVGIPIMMEIPAERGFLFASAVLAVGLVGLVGLLAVTVILWGIGVEPMFTS